MNRSGWKNTEWEIARALGGKRRLRTMESFGKTATDVYFPKSMRKQMPFLNHLKVEVKKRRKVNIHAMFAEAILKYKRHPDDKIILATRIPATKKTGEKWRRLQLKFKKATGKKLRRTDLISPLITVDLQFFVELFYAWKMYNLLGSPIIFGTKFRKKDIYKEIIDAAKRQEPGKIIRIRRFPRKPNHSAKSDD